MHLYDHQLKIIREGKKKCGLFLGTGSGKTMVALFLARGKTLVVCPKQQKLDCTWEKNLKKCGLKVNLTVISKERFRSLWMDLPQYDTVIFDEAHEGILGVTPSVVHRKRTPFPKTSQLFEAHEGILGVTPSVVHRKRTPFPKTSQLFEAAHDFLLKHNPDRVYLVTATPTRSPMAVWGAGVLLGRWSTETFFMFRDAFYIPMPTARNVYLVRNDRGTKDRLGHLVRTLGYTGRLEDWLDVPDQTYRDEHIGTTKEQQNMLLRLETLYPDPLVLSGKCYQAENGFVHLDDKTVDLKECYTPKILQYLEEFDRVFIVVLYLHQIEHIRAFLERNDMPVLVLSGSTKDRKGIIEQAQQMEYGAVIAQADMTSGYELPTFRCTLFISTSHKIVSYIQAVGRTLRANALAKNLYVRFVHGEQSEARWKSIDNKEDFHEATYAKRYEKKRS